MRIFDKFKKKNNRTQFDDVEVEVKFMELMTADDSSELEADTKDVFVPDSVSTFKINGTEFGIGKVRFELSEDGRLQNLDIWGSEKIYNEIIDGVDEKESHPWDWTLYPPHVYFWEVDLSIDGTIVIDDELLDEYDIALYLVEHTDFYGTLVITNEYIEINAEIGDSAIESPRTIEIWIDRKSL